MRLALTYGAEACRSVEEHLRRMAFDVDTPPASLNAHAALLAADSTRDFYTQVLSGAALDETGRLLTQSRDELGEVTLRDELLIAQGELRRLADQVLAPAARQIHRDDLLVPESILLKFRQMGVFGLSIPERYGGSAPDDREDTLMMIVVTEALSEGSLGAGGSLITRPEILSRALCRAAPPRNASIGCRGSRRAIPCAPSRSQNLTTAPTPPACSSRAPAP